MEKDLCIRCGECCRLKEWDATHTVFLRTEKTCPHLKFASDGLFFCDTYHDRPDKVKLSNGQELKCTSAREAAKEGLLPPYCPYTAEIPNYQTKVYNYVNYQRYAPQTDIFGEIVKSIKPIKYVIKGGLKKCQK